MSAAEEARAAIEQIKGLRELAKRGMKTHRSEHKLLNQLSDEALPIVAAAIAALDSK